MGKIFIILISILLMINGMCVALTGSATIEPMQLPNNSFGHTIIINFYPANTMTWTNGKIQINIPQQFPNQPSLTATDNGYLEAIIMRGGTTEEPVSIANIQVEGYTITINALTLSANDSLKVIYGSKSSGGYGIGTPMIPGTYVFKIMENPTGGNPSMIAVQPIILISNLAISKSASANYVMAQDTLAYYITYSNLSSVHQIQNVYIWDTIPSQFNILQIIPQPTFNDGNFYVWNIGTVMYFISNVIVINLKAKDGIIKNGTQIINSVSATGNDMYNNIYNASASNTINVYGVDFSVAINAMPSGVHTGQNITVIMQVTNNGNTNASYVRPDSFSFTGSGSATLLTGPLPSVVNVLYPLGIAKFTWTYSATLVGEISFSGRAMCYEGSATRTVYSSLVQSNQVIISYPPTSTPTKTSTFVIPTETGTGIPTLTFTYTNTPVIPTATPTKTPTNSSTETGTNTCTATEIITETETFTETPTNTKTLPFTATETKTIAPAITPTKTQTPVVNVILDKNYIDISKGEKVKIAVKEEKDKKIIIKIYSLTGELVKKFEFITMRDGWNEIEWGANNLVGKTVGRGIYFLHIWVEGSKEIRRVYVIK